MDNPDYKAQLFGKYSRIGVGYATAEDGIPHWCVILGLSLGPLGRARSIK